MSMKMKIEQCECCGVNLEESRIGICDDCAAPGVSPDPDGMNDERAEWAGTAITAVVKEFAFDCTFIAAIRVKASSEAEARAMLREHINAADSNMGVWPNGDPILCEISLDDDRAPYLYEIDGEEV